MRFVIVAWFATIVAASPAVAADEWQASKDVGIASGDKDCFISSPSVDVSVLISVPGDQTSVFRVVMVGNKIDPGSYQHLAIEGQRFKTADNGFAGSEAETIIALLKKAERVAFEWEEWPTLNHHAGEIPTANVGNLIADCEAWVVAP